MGFIEVSYLPFDRESEQHVARLSLSTAGIHVHDAVHDGRAARLQRAAGALHLIHGPEILGRVVVPDNLAVDGRVRPQMPVHRAREGGARNHRDRLHLRVPAGRRFCPAAGGRRRGRTPAPGSRLDVDGGEAPRGVGRLRVEPRQRDVETAVIRGGTPCDAAGRVRDGCLELPKHLARVLRIEGIDQAGALAHEQRLPAARGSAQHGGTIDSREAGLRRGELLGPADFAIRELERNHRIGQRLRRRRVRRISRRHVHEAPGGVHGGRRHDRDTGRREARSVAGCVAHGPRLVAHEIALPFDMAARDLERRDAAAKRAAGVARIARRFELARAHRHVQTSEIERRSLDARERMRLDLRLPQKRPALGIERVYRPLVVAEQSRARSLDDLEMCIGQLVLPLSRFSGRRGMAGCG